MSTIARKFNRRIEIQHLAAGEDAIGQPLPASWVLYKKIWANIRFLSGDESIKADSVKNESKVSFRIRYRTDVKVEMRIVYNGTTYKIKAVLPDEVKREHVDLSCEAIK